MVLIVCQLSSGRFQHAGHCEYVAGLRSTAGHHLASSIIKLKVLQYLLQTVYNSLAATLTSFADLWSFADSVSIARSGRLRSHIARVSSEYALSHAPRNDRQATSSATSMCTRKDSHGTLKMDLWKATLSSTNGWFSGSRAVHSSWAGPVSVPGGKQKKRCHRHRVAIRLKKGCWSFRRKSLDLFT